MLIHYILMQIHQILIQIHHTHANSSYSHSPQPYYVTHPSFVIDNNDDYQGEIQGDAQKYKLTTTMMLLAKAITQHYSTPTNNRNGNRNVGRISRTESTPGKTNVQCYNCNGKGHYACECPKLIVRDAKYYKEQMLLATKDEDGVQLDEKENDFMLDNAYGDNTLEELNATSNHEQRHHETLETIIHTSNDDQTDFDIIFEDLYLDDNSGQAEHDTNAHDQSLHDFESLIIYVQVEDEKQRKMNIELQKQKALLQRELETCKEWVKEFENKPKQPLGYKESCGKLQNEMNVEKEQLLNQKEEICEELLKMQDETLKIKRETDLYKKPFKEREDKYLEDIVLLEEKL
ncbi:retrovirus-related pol polyprotein from transposon TNT 1-94 [Tanacetum coccineum]